MCPSLIRLTRLPISSSRLPESGWMQIPTTETGGVNAPRLSPSAALERYAPPEGAMAHEEGEKAQQRRYGFHIGSMGLLIAPRVGSEAIPMSPIAAIPNSPPWLKGMLNLRGALVPVFDLTLVLGMSGHEYREQQVVLVFDKGPKAVGIVVDGYPKQLLGLSRVAQLPELPTSLKGYVAAAYTHDGDLWLEFDHEEFFKSLNRKRAE